MSSDFISSVRKWNITSNGVSKIFSTGEWWGQAFHLDLTKKLKGWPTFLKTHLIFVNWTFWKLSLTMLGKQHQVRGQLINNSITIHMYFKRSNQQWRRPRKLYLLRAGKSQTETEKDCTRKWMKCESGKVSLCYGSPWSVSPPSPFFPPGFLSSIYYL